MSRPAHIAPLDAALVEAVAKIDDADRAVAEWLDKHGPLLDEWDEIAGRRADLYRNVRTIEDAIRKLGYVVLDVSKTRVTIGHNKSNLGDRTYSSVDDREAARERLSHDPKKLRDA